MAATVQATSSTAFGEKSTVTITKPTGTVDNDLLIAAVYYEDGTITTVPTGWTLIRDSRSATAYMATYYKVASSEGASWDWVLDATANAGAVCLRIDGYAPTAQISTSAIGTSLNDPTPTLANSVTPTYPNALLVFCVGAGDIVTSGQDTVSAYAIATDNPTWAEQADLPGGGLDVLAVATANRTQTTATGNSSCTIGDGSTESLADTNGIMIVVESATPVSVSAQVQSATFSVQAPTIKGKSSLTASVLSATWSVLSPIVTAVPLKWIFRAKNTGNWTNQNKS